MQYEKSALRWSADRGLRLHWRTWDDEVMLYHPRSDETHCLNPLATQVLLFLQENPMTTSEVKALLARNGVTLANPREIDALLEQFDTLGLISPMLP